MEYNMLVIGLCAIVCITIISLKEQETVQRYLECDQCRKDRLKLNGD